MREVLTWTDLWAPRATCAKPPSKQLATVLEGVIRTVLTVRGCKLPGFVVGG